MARFYMVPHYIYDKGRLHLDLGFRLSAAMKYGSFRRNQFVYPDLKMDLALSPDAMRLFLNVGGGEKLISYSHLLERNHHVDLAYGIGSPLALVTPSIERVSGRLELLSFCELVSVASGTMAENRSLKWLRYTL